MLGVKDSGQAHPGSWRAVRPVLTPSFHGEGGIFWRGGAILRTGMV